MKFGKFFAGKSVKNKKVMKKEENKLNEEELKNTQETIEENAPEVEENADAEQSEEQQESANDELEAVKKQLAETKDSYLRLMAEYDNFKKRTLKEKSDLLKYGGESIIKNLLPVIDDFERALAHMPEEDSPLKEGIELIYKKFGAFLDQNNVKEIPTKDADFNTDFHEAATLFPAADESQKNKVIDCIQKGYTYNDKVIRFAKVVVAQ